LSSGRAPANGGPDFSDGPSGASCLQRMVMHRLPKATRTITAGDIKAWTATHSFSVARAESQKPPG